MGGALHKTKKVGGVALPADQQASLPLDPHKEPFDEPAGWILAQMTPVLGFQFARRSVRGNHVHAVLLKVIVEPIAVIGAIADEVLRLGFEHVEVESQLHERDLMMIGGMRAHREWQPMAIDNREDLAPLPRRVYPMSSPPPLAEANVASIKLSRSSITPSRARCSPAV